MQQKIFLTSRKLIFQKCKLYLKKYGHYAWSRRRDLIFSLIIFYFSCKFIFYLWYIKIPKDEPSILCSFGRGRLGNQMSSFATMYSFAKKHGFRYFVTPEQADQLSYYFEPEQLSLNVIDQSLPDYYLSVFGLTLSRLYWESPWDKLDNVDNNFDYSRMEDTELHNGRAINIGDYPNQVRDIVPHLPDIRSKFRFRARFRERAEDLLQAELMKRNMAGAEITWVGVHNRRTDYQHHLGALYGLNLLEADYFKRAMNIFTQDYSQVIFIVVTDDMEWAEKNLQIPGIQVAFLGHRRVLELDTEHPLATADDIGDDLALLAACNHTILSYGTFGQWAALLAGGRTVISSTAALTKEGRELREAGLGPGTEDTSGWVWLEAGEARTGGQSGASSKEIPGVISLVCTLFTVLHTWARLRR